MKNFLSRYVWLSLIAGALGMLTSCEKFLAVDPPKDKLPPAFVFSDSTSASSAITGIYSQFTQGNGGFLASHMVWAGLCSDELDYSGQELRRSQFFQNTIAPDNSYLGGLWVFPYQHIHQANSVIEGVTGSETIASTAKPVLIGEAKFFRAFIYFYLTNYFGDLPLSLVADYRQTESLPRIPVEQIYEQIIADLEAAHQALPEAYLTAERVRPNKSTVAAFLARVHLYRQHWAQAEQYASQVIETGNYLPLPPVGEVFLKESKETIWQIFPATSREETSTYDAYQYVPSSFTNAVIPNYLIPGRAMAAFEAGDLRKPAWIGQKTIGADTYHFPYKYKVLTGAAAGPLTEYTVAFRLSEQLLIRAEARARLSDREGAIADLNIIRRRAGIADLAVPANDDAVLALVDTERQYELFCEWGHRWLDLKRTGQADAVLGALKGDFWQPTDVLWPLPIAQLLSNPNFEQNIGY